MTPAEHVLAQRARHAVALLRDAPPDWVPPREGTDHDVLVVGGGQSGLAISFGLRRAGIGRVSVIDQAPAGREGVWSTIARMPTLRTAKTLTGPELGIAELSFQAWYEAVSGEAAYAALERIPTDAWARYLAWYREATGAEVRNATRLLRIEPSARGLKVHLRLPDGRLSAETTRKLVLSTGVGGCGAPRIPAMVSDALEPGVYSHTQQALPDLAGARVAVLGAAASAFDAASTLLEKGAAEVRLFCRQPDLARGSRLKAFSHVGAFEFFHRLPDEQRWRLMRVYRERGGAAPRPSVLRAARFDNFHLHLGSRWLGLRQEGGEIRLQASDGEFAFDYLVLATGYAVDLRLRPELEGVAERVATWGDRYQPDWGARDEELARHPYLGAGFEFVEKVAGGAPWVADVHCFSAPAMASHGRPVGDTGSLKHNVPRLVSALGRDLFLGDMAWQVAYLQKAEGDDLYDCDYLGRVWRGSGVEVGVVSG